MGEALRRRIRSEKFDGPLQEALLNLLVAADHVRQAVNKTCIGHGLTIGQYNVLRILRGAPHGHPRSEILRRMVEPAPDVTRLVDRLEARGLVERDRSDKDRRLSITRITPKGLAMLERLDPDIASFHAWFESRVPPQECQHLNRICEGIYGPDTAARETS